MHNKQDIIIKAERTCLLFKAMRLTSLVPLLVTDIFIPTLLAFLCFKIGINEIAIKTARQLYGLFMPIMSCWWVIFAHKQIYEDAGAEVLAVSKSKGRFSDLIIFFTLGVLNALVSATAWFFIFDGFFLYWVKLLLVSLFFFGIICFTASITKSTTAVFVAVTLYLILNIFPLMQTVSFPLYYSPEADTDIFFCKVPLAVVGILLIVAVKVLLKKRQHL